MHVMYIGQVFVEVSKCILANVAMVHLIKQVIRVCHPQHYYLEVKKSKSYHVRHSAHEF